MKTQTIGVYKIFIIYIIYDSWNTFVQYLHH